MLYFILPIFSGVVLFELLYSDFKLYSMLRHYKRFDLHKLLTELKHFPAKFLLTDLPASLIPNILIQIPVYNESAAIRRRTLAYASALQWPASKLFIQMLDDSDDPISAVYWQEKGYNVEVIHRKDRVCAKSGALANGLEKGFGPKAEFVAVLDSDFRPTEHWLQEAYWLFYEYGPMLACVQTRWIYSNASKNWVTRIAEALLCGHMVVEKIVNSSRRGRSYFNGSAALWRVSYIQKAGGWITNSLSEDVDLSTRVTRIGGWIRYAPAIVCSSELPEELNVLKQQQVRWCIGGTQNGVSFWSETYLYRFIYIIIVLAFGFEFHCWWYSLGAILLFGSPYLLSLPYYVFATNEAHKADKLPKISWYKFLTLPVFGWYSLFSCTLGVVKGLLPFKYKFKVTKKYGAS